MEKRIDLLSKLCVTKKIVFAIIFIAGLISYSTILNANFILDDFNFILENQFVHNFDIKQIYSTSVTHGAGLVSNFYRPNQQLVYAIIYNFFGLNPVPYHITSVFVHILNSFLVYLIISFLIKHDKSAFIAALFFLLHPVHTQSVSFISALAGPLGTFFLLSGILFLIKSWFNEYKLKSYTNCFLALMMFIIAFFCKEDMVICGPISLIFAIYFWPKLKQDSRRICAASVMITALLCAFYLSLKFTVFSFTDIAGLTIKNDAYTSNIHVRLITFLNILFDYFTMIFWPIRLNYDKGYEYFTTLFTFRALFGIGIIGLAVAGFFSKKISKEIFLGLLLFFAALIPYTGIISLNALYLEHWLYVPLLGVSLVLAYVIKRYCLNLKPIIAFGLIISMMSMFIVRITLRNYEWASTEKFYLNELRYSKDSTLALYGLAKYYCDNGFYDVANLYATRVTQLDPDNANAYHIIAVTHLVNHRFQEAVRYLEKAISVDEFYTRSITLLEQIKDRNPDIFEDE